MKVPVRRLRHTTVIAIAAAATLSVAASARAPGPTVPPSRAVREVVVDSPLHYGSSAAKAVVDSITLMGPGGTYPYRGDFETANALPGGDGALPDGWTSVDNTGTESHWHVDGYNNPGTGNGAVCRDPYLAPCGIGDPAGGYGNSWHEELEFRKSVSGAVSVRIQGRLRYDTEPGYDYVTLQRRTAAHPDLEPVSGGQGLSWDGQGDVILDYTFYYTADEHVDGDQVVIAFVFDSDSMFSDADCQWPTDGAAMIDDLEVTVTAGVATTYVEDFEDGLFGPDWSVSTVAGVGDFARVWRGLCDADPCADNASNQVAFIDLYPDLWILPPPPAGCGAVNNTGGALGPDHHLDNAVLSPVMTLPGGGATGLTLDFDVYAHELLIPNDTPGILYTWSVRSAAAGQDINQAGWRDRNFVYPGGPAYMRRHNEVGDLLEPYAERVQVQFAAVEMGWAFGFDGTNGTPAPYFDNVRVLAYPATGPRFVLDERYLANDGFPASGMVDRANPAANSVRFDMAANISDRTHQRNDPGDSITVYVTPREGGTLQIPVMHWTFAVRNPLFDMHRALPANPVLGNVTRSATGGIVWNRYNFDLPDTGMLFPGDVLHYYFAATDNVWGDIRTARVPDPVSGFGDPTPGAWPDLCTVRCLPSLDAYGHQPPRLFWNDQGLDGGVAAWYEALACGVAGRDFDVYNTHAPKHGLGNGLGGRATLQQIADYDVILYSAGTLGSPTLSNGDFAGDPGNDLALVDAWLGLDYRGLFLAGDDLAQSLYSSGTAGQAFLAGRMGVEYRDSDVSDDIGGQVAPRVVANLSSVSHDLRRWQAHGGCPDLNDFDNMAPTGAAVSLGEFTAPDGISTPYGCAAMIRGRSGTSTVITMNHDLQFVFGADAYSPLTVRGRLLVNILYSLDSVFDWCRPTAVDGDAGPAAPPLLVDIRPNPFNPSAVLSYRLRVPGRVTMKVYDARGALVRTLLDEDVKGVNGAVVWDGADDRGGRAASGLYFVETRAGGQVDVRKVTMLK